jgi:hypothetical protein
MARRDHRVTESRTGELVENPGKKWPASDRECGLGQIWMQMGNPRALASGQD